MLEMEARPNAFKTDLCSAPCKAPCTCLMTGICPCCAACYWRKKSLETYGAGMQDYECCQGYISCPCCPFSMFKGTTCGLCLEGMCCDTLSISTTRIFIMDVKSLHPDPVDYQIIRFSNCLQIAACVCSFAAMITQNDACREASQILNIIAECAVRTVEGCMGVQISHEINDTRSSEEVAEASAGGTGGSPPAAITDEQLGRGPANYGSYEEKNVESPRVTIRVPMAQVMNDRED
mmetsp:Transcript_42955/g.97159  ORF Transcript_42955/g.97159 Transcript_42955/m.97159 type:complete len:235 (-) Transcript_42955:88-792(-)